MSVLDLSSIDFPPFLYDAASSVLRSQLGYHLEPFLPLSVVYAQFYSKKDIFFVELWQRPTCTDPDVVLILRIRQPRITFVPFSTSTEYLLSEPECPRSTPRDCSEHNSPPPISGQHQFRVLLPIRRTPPWPPSPTLNTEKSFQASLLALSYPTRPPPWVSPVFGRLLAAQQRRRARPARHDLRLRNERGS
jgi:hypothetical protein